MHTIEHTIGVFNRIVVQKTLQKKFYSAYRAYITGELIFGDNSRLIFLEVKDSEILTKDKYSYHYMDSGDNLVFRYDNAKHHHEIGSFPHHKHLPDGVIGCAEPCLEDVLYEIEEMISKFKKL